MKEKRGGAPTRSKEEKLIDLEFITPLFLKGLRYTEIAVALQAVREYPVNYKTIIYDVSQLLKIWKAERSKLIPEVLEIQLRKLEKMEVICWEQYEKSKQPKIRTVQKQKDLHHKAKPNEKKKEDELMQRISEKHTTEMIGDGQWLDRIFRCWEMQAELLDLKSFDKGGPKENQLPILQPIFMTRARKNNPQYEDAIEVTDNNVGDINQKLLQA